MSIANAPRFTTADAERIARELYGRSATAAPLTSERDQNFLLTQPDGVRAVLKISNASESRALIEAQNAAMRVCEPTGLTQRVLATSTGGRIADVMDAAGARHMVRLVSFIDGVPAGTVGWQSPAYRADLGRAVARITRALEGFDHAAAHREFYWDLARGFDVCREYAPLIRDAKMKALVKRVLFGVESRASAWDDLRTSVIQNDANDFNVIVADRGERVTGLIDFGDMVHSWTVGDLAIASTYACLGQRDPLTAICDVVGGYASERSLRDNEYSALLGLILLRLCTSVCVAAYQTKQRPHDAYLSVSQQAIAATLPILADVHPRFAEASFRVAAGLDASSHAKRVATFIKQKAKGVKPILGRKLDARSTMPIPLDVASALVSGDARENTEPKLTERIFAAMNAAGARVTFGGYGEARLLYTSPLFAHPQAKPGESRTVHLGIDLFAEAGTPVHAPLSGKVVIATYNPAKLDYGCLIVLEHQLPPAENRPRANPARLAENRPRAKPAPSTDNAFYSIYGHLSRASLKRVKVGRTVAAGARLGEFGTPTENGGWTPHLHFQLVTDLLDMGKDFPGVARPTEAAAWLSICPDPSALLGLPRERMPLPSPSKAETLAARRERLGANLSIAYRDPLKVVRGHMQYLYDDVGRKYIDAYNNVPHVGHAHTRIVQAAAAQMAVLNTNTRYLHDAVNQFATELCETLPKSLNTVFFVNSGSEANDLALRLARAHTGARDMIVLEAAYHGITTSLIDLSPYKHAGPGGEGAPDWVHAVPIPDDYRGPYKRNDKDAGRKYADFVRIAIEQLQAENRPRAKPAPRTENAVSFIAESCPSVGGQIILPPGYLKAVYEHVRAAGGVCIADEVQTGYGRIGTHFWGFEQQGVVPDIVVLGKPIGNGYPIGAVVTTRDIAEHFNNGMEFFSTFGGSTVSAVVGLEVLRTTREERLMQHARQVGDAMLKLLRTFVGRFPIVGDVRGSGLFLGVELVRDRESLEPAADEASWVVNRMRDEGILLGTDGPFHNVLKIRPPMPFDARDADVLVTTLARVLSQLQL